MQQIIRKGILGERVKDCAMAKRIPISTLEREAGYSPGMISRWIAAGDEDYNALTKLVKLADLLGVSLDELVGRKAGEISAVMLNSPIPQLQAETCTGQLLWFPWQPDSGLPAGGIVPVCKSGRSCGGGWWTDRKGLKFMLTCFCDDIRDEDEHLELYLHCTPGHGLPLVCIVPDSDATLSELYTQILLRATFAQEKDASYSESVLVDKTASKTIPFRAQSK